MNVLLLTTHLNTGGVGIYTVTLAKYLVKNGIGVIVASSGGDLEKTLAENGIRHAFLDIKTKSEFGVKVWKALPVLCGLIRSENIQLIHAQTRVAQVLSAISGRMLGVPFVSTGHGFFQHRRLGRLIFPCWGRKVVAISKSVARHLMDDFNLPRQRVQVVRTGIELDRFLNCAQGAKDTGMLRAVGLKEHKLTVGAVGRLSSVKGFIYLVDAFKKVISGEPDIQLLIVGDGPQKNVLEERINELGIRDKAVLVEGSVKLEKYYPLMDIFCLTSLKEGLGLALMEAMASARPCIASRVGGLSELIDNGVDGLLVEPGNSDALARVILDLARNETLRKSLARKAHEKATGFSITESVRQTIEVYRGVIEKERIKDKG